MSKTVCIHVRDMQPGDVYIGRAVPRRRLKASKWANPFPIDRNNSREDVIRAYRNYLRVHPELLADLHELKGKRLACWCKPDEACHGDVLVELAEAL